MTDHVLRWLEQGQQALEASRFADAIDTFTRVRDVLPADVSIAMALANVYRLSGDALMTRRTLLVAHADGAWMDPATAFALGAALLEAGAPQEAATCFERALKAMPRDPAALGALAGAKRALGKPSAAWPLVHQALSKAPANPALLLTAAQIRHDLADLPGALRWLDRADAVRPNHSATKMQRAYTLLLQGASRAGWAAFEARPLPVPATRARPWHGEPLDGATVLVTAEQGVGDQFQFVRFIADLLTRGAARVVVECHADAVSLFLANDIDAVARGAPPETDWHVPMLSLPHRLALDTDVGGDRVPYLRATQASSDLPPRTADRRRLGLVWAGNPSFTGRFTRDFDVALLPDILRIPNIDWISLQHGASGEVAVSGLTRVPLSTDWAWTAAMLGALDGLVTTDTGIAHLAGALGIPTWVMLQHVPDWRWGLHGDSSPWYPTIRLVRQARSNDWKSVLERLSRVLLG